MKMRNTVFIACITLLYMSSSYSMFVRTIASKKRVFAPLIIKRKYYYESESKEVRKLLSKAKKLSLPECYKAHKTRSKCNNFLCCKSALSDLFEPSSFEQKQKFLRLLDENEERLSFVYRIKRAYNRFIKIDEQIKNAMEYSSISQELESELRREHYLILDQKDCLRKQLRTIYDDSPVLYTSEYKITFGITEYGRVFVKKRKLSLYIQVAKE